MKNFKKLIIDNFQNHKHTEIEFSDGITVFVGKTDCGKTSIFRAIKLLLKNKPRGIGFISVFAPKDKKNKPTTKIELTLEDDTVIQRIRSENVNKYTIITGDKEENFENFGVNIPPEIKEVIGPCSVKIDAETNFDINISEQLAPPFLLLETPSLKTKVIDKIAKIDILNKAIKNNHNKIQNKNAEEKQTVQELEILTNNLKTFENLDTEIEKLNILKAKLSKLKELQNKLLVLKQLEEEYKQVTLSINKGNEIIKKISDFISKTATTYVKLKENENKLYFLLTNKNSLENIDKEVCDIKRIITQKDILILMDSKIKNLNILRESYLKYIKYVTQLNSIDNEMHILKNKIKSNSNIKQLEYKSNTLKNMCNTYFNIISLYNNLNEIDKNIGIAHNFIPDQINKLNADKNKLKELLKQIKICPFCQSEISEEKINSI